MMLFCIGLTLAAIMPQRIVPNKIVYAEAEKGWADIVFTNSVAAQASAEYVVTDSWGIAGERREICRDRIDLDAAACKTIRVAWPGSAIRYGHELRVTILKSAPTDSCSSFSRSEYFAVNNDWWRVAQGCGLDTLATKLTPLFRQFMEYYGLSVRETVSTAADRLWMNACRHEGFGMGPFPGYWTLLTRWQMQLSSVGGNKAASDIPDGKTWYTITECTESRDSGRIREDSRVSHDWGVHHTRYTIGNMEGPFGFEAARKHPEFILRNARGQFAGNYGSERTNPRQIANLNLSAQTGWTYLKPNFHRDDVVEWAIKDLADGIDGFDEDGVYWDGLYVPNAGFDAFGKRLPGRKDPASIGRMEKTRKRWIEMLLEGHPNRFAWYNLAEPDPTKRRPDMEHSRVGSLMEIQWPFLLDRSMPYGNYRGYLDYLLPARDTRYLPYPDGKKPSKMLFVGYLYPMFERSRRKDPCKYREVWTMAQHAMAILASTLAHPIAGGPQMRNFKQMMMRYAEFYWHEDIEVYVEGYKKFACDSLREVWYDDMIYVRKFKDHTDYYIHLVNVPESEECREDVEEDPPEVDDAEISTNLFGSQGVKAWAVQPYGYLDPVLEPHCQSVEVKCVNGETVLVVPPFKYYTLMVVRVPGAGISQFVGQK